MIGEHKHKTAAEKPANAALPKAGVAGSVKRAPWIKNPKGMMTIAAAVLILGLAAGGVIYLQQRTPKLVQVCDSNIARDAAEQYELKNLTTLGRAVERIKLKQYYDRDPNCLYIVAQYQMISGDINGAKAGIDKLKKDYPKAVFHKELDGGKASIQNLEGQFKMNQEVEDNANGSFDQDI